MRESQAIDEQTFGWKIGFFFFDHIWSVQTCAYFENTEQVINKSVDKKNEKERQNQRANWIEFFLDHSLNIN